MKDISDLPELEAMREGVAYNFPVQIRKWKVNLRPLTVGETMQINNEVLADLQQIAPTMRHQINESYLLAKYMLKKASAPPPPSTVLGPITDALLDGMTVDEVLFAYKQYLEGVERVNPRYEEMTQETLVALVDSIKKKESAPTDLSFSQLASVVSFLLTHSG
jgi:hypothetical protein